MWARVSHADPSNTIVLEFKVLIRKPISIDAYSWETRQDGYEKSTPASQHIYKYKYTVEGIPYAPVNIHLLMPSPPLHGKEKEEDKFSLIHAFKTKSRNRIIDSNSPGSVTHLAFLNAGFNEPYWELRIQNSTCPGS